MSDVEVQALTVVTQLAILILIWILLGERKKTYKIYFGLVLAILSFMLMAYGFSSQNFSVAIYHVK